MEIKRTSLKIRNPKNRPDEDEKKALQYFVEEKKKTGRLPGFHVQVLKDGDNTRYRYYKPLAMAPLCLMCHGESIADPVKKILREKYPDDKATGYQAGDFRGVIRVTIPASLINK